MEEHVRRAIFAQVAKEPFAKKLDLQLVELDDGYSVVEMTFSQDVENIFGMAHGGAIFGLIDEAFETACQTDGTIAVALNVNVTYISSPEPGKQLRATAKEISRTKRTANYEIKVTELDERLIATCQALAFRTGKPIPFL